MTKSPTPLPLTPSQVSDDNYIVEDSWYGLSVCVLRGGGALRNSFEIYKCLMGDFICFLWTEKGLAFLDQSRTEMPGTPTQRLQVKEW